MKHLSSEIARTTEKEKVKLSLMDLNVILSIDGDTIATDLKLPNRPSHMHPN